MILIVGLGNPGEKYKKTFHNIGFKAIEELAEKNSFSEFKIAKKLDSLTAEGSICGKKIRLAKPLTFMNNSGEAVLKLIQYFKTSKKNLIVVHDDIDLPIGKMKISENRGSAGHKGIESIIGKIGSKNFIRIRIGAKTGFQKDSNMPVLEKMGGKEELAFKKSLPRICQAIETLVDKGAEKAMNLFNAANDSEE